MKRSLKTNKRGYILLEVAIAGAITSVAVLGLLGLLSDVQVKSVASSRDITAQGLLRREVERVRALKFGTVSAQAATQVPGLMGKYAVSWAISSGTEALFGSDATGYKDVTVKVTHPEGSKVRAHQTVVRVYE